jgi:hypothetical protein
MGVMSTLPETQVEQHVLPMISYEEWRELPVEQRQWAIEQVLKSPINPGELAVTAHFIAAVLTGVPAPVVYAEPQSDEPPTRNWRQERGLGGT